MDMRTPLGKVRGLGSAKSGTEHFWRVRTTSVALVPLLVFYIVFLIIYAGRPYAEVVGALANPFVATINALTIVASIVHMRLGMEEIIQDYIHSEGMKIALLILNAFFSFLIGGLCLLAVLKIAFAG
ncbi:MULTISPECIES: succinate dehydrogenase, hydrophobic membrane anchor protein [Rhizobium/Agrobacterium group]|uniref:Succinate dehydrogenase hydrophobic membrane anchor subunit n=2 Tax=Neorhizobium TaxID=1525371 RepID=A0ABV0LYL4_9HYPH|nr:MULTISPECIES: succinate dehydrogenase, hydrophobic membrane anchor protein [Rhizobium/Agrobacterium group]KGD87534.1 succinate dehydrogenase [Rhizobium sp. YS-1r]MCC2612380.1 succinate dehydrogenase, hydrophobic membrane anchor protein [Neorhizobium petrolearium]WGI67514.1 succinate dehydrogenase, hydrophobic membrane anchor protein [Neorhizobium petrolearium]